MGLWEKLLTTLYLKYVQLKVRLMLYLFPAKYEFLQVPPEMKLK